MIREDKFGRRIYSDTVWNRMLRTGQKLAELGYQESKSKPNLFYAKTDGVAFFADLRGTKQMPIWDDARPYFYWEPNPEFPPWKCRRLVRQEYSRLGINECKVRLSFYFYKDPLFEGSSSSVDEENSVFDCDDGFCRKCGKDFQDEGSFCSEECEKEYHESLKATCAVCGKKIDFSKEEEHHISYKPEMTAWVHKGCHGKIHKTNLYPDLKPKEDDLRAHRAELEENKTERFTTKDLILEYLMGNYRGYSEKDLIFKVTRGLHVTEDTVKNALQRLHRSGTISLEYTSGMGRVYSIRENKKLGNAFRRSKDGTQTLLGS
jgi:hypothetical protein